jgi:VIT1/CCC1 family predicted Fe2+/Mn2+ transporter
MKQALNTGFSFGLTSGIITTLGLIVGLHGTTNSSLIIIGGILTIAIADAFSDSLGIHISQESDNRSTKDIWESTVSTFLTKFFFAMTFIIPVLLLDITTAITVSILWGLLIITIISLSIAKKNKEAAWKVVGEHLLITLVVIVSTHFVGDWVAVTFV